VTADAVKQTQEAIAKHGRTMETHVYDAKHAFCNDHRPDVYDAKACAQAWQRTTSAAHSSSSSGSVDSVTGWPQPLQTSSSTTSRAIAHARSSSVHSASPGPGIGRPRNSERGTPQARAASSSRR